MLGDKIALGTVQFGTNYGISNISGQTPENEVRKILNMAFQNGITILDTAFSYGNSECVLGKYHSNRFKIVTKFFPENIHGSIDSQFKTSLKNLDVAEIYGYLAHRPLDLIKNKQIWKYLRFLQEENKVAKIGFSLNTPEEYYLLKDAGLIPNLIQIPFNYFDKRFLKIIDDLKNIKCEIHSRSTFLQGLFFIDVEKLPVNFFSIKHIIKNLQDCYSDSLNGALLRHVLDIDLIDKVVIGVDNSSQLLSNLSDLNKKLILPELLENIPTDILQPSKWKL